MIQAQNKSVEIAAQVYNDDLHKILDMNTSMLDYEESLQSIEKKLNAKIGQNRRMIVSKLEDIRNDQTSMDNFNKITTSLFDFTRKIKTS